MTPLGITATSIADVKLVSPKHIGDHRGYFMEVWHAGAWREAGLDVAFVQINQSSSAPGTLRGLHYQLQQPQGKLVRAVRGSIFDVAVDIRRSSPTFGRWVGESLSGEDRRMLWIPPGFAHGFCVLGDAVAEIEYYCTDLHAPAAERIIAWNDPDLAIAWPLVAGKAPVLSARDAAGTPFSGAEYFP